MPKPGGRRVLIYGRRKNPGYIPKALTRGVCEILRVCHHGRTGFIDFQVGECSHGQQGIPQFDRIRGNASSLTVPPDKGHDLIDKVRVP